MALKLKNVDGKWYAWGKVKGRLIRRSTGYPARHTQAVLAAAERKKTEIELAVRAERDGWTKRIPTVREYWRTVYKPTYTVQKAAPELDDQLMAHALPLIGDRRLDQIKKSDCVRLLNHRRASYRATPRHRRPVKVAEGSVQRLRGFLQGFFQRAVDDEIIDRNPWRTIDREEYAVRDRVVTEAEQAEMLARLSPRYQRFVLFLLGTGVRLDECLGVFRPHRDDAERRRDPATDVNRDAREVRVIGKGNKLRWVPVPEALLPIIDDQIADGWWCATASYYRDVLRDACQARAAVVGRISRRGKVVPPRAARTAIDLITPHTLRHTFGHRWLTGGGDIYQLSKVLGHASVAVTERHYAHVLKGDLRAAADRVDLRLGLSTPTGKVVAGRFGA